MAPFTAWIGVRVGEWEAANHRRLLTFRDHEAFTAYCERALEVEAK
jgi:hypothetical protein